MPAPRVLVVTSEAIPLVKTGGLADVITVLAATLHQHEVDATIMMPGYPAALDGALSLHEVASLPDLPGGPGRLLLGAMPGTEVPVLLLDTAAFRTRTGNPYVAPDGNEYGDNAQCFAALAHAAVEVCAGNGGIARPQVVHANDWHVGLVPALLKLRGIDDVGSVLTIHNLAFQGNFPQHLAGQLGLPDGLAESMEYWGQISFLKAGIRYADRITTVSKSYAREILTERFGYGMQGLLAERGSDLRAISNAVDNSTWNPATDELILQQFSVDDLTGKAANKAELQRLSGLPLDAGAPLLALGSRITHQKMADVALAALPVLLERHPHLQVAVLGQGERHYEDGFRDLASRFPQQVGLYIGYDEQRAHALHAGADMLLHGSRFEPYGLTPIYSMGYGTLPICSRVGGLIDAIVDPGQDDMPEAGANGFLFEGEQCDDMVAAIERAMLWQQRPAAWLAMQRNAMTGDYSWEGPATEYISLFEEVAPESDRTDFARARRVTPVLKAASRPAATVATPAVPATPAGLTVPSAPVKPARAKVKTASLRVGLEALALRRVTHG